MSYYENNVSMLINGLNSRGLMLRAIELGGLAGVNAAIESEAEWIGDLDGHGFGSSDMNCSLRNIFADLGEPDLFGWDAARPVAA